MLRKTGQISRSPSRLTVTIAAVATFSFAGAAFAIAAPGGHAGNSGGLNHGGKPTSGGNSSCVSGSCDHNPTDYTKPCTGGGCQVQLPDTPCERGHGGVEMHNKHCGPPVPVVSPSPTRTAPPTSSALPTHRTADRRAHHSVSVGHAAGDARVRGDARRRDSRQGGDAPTAPPADAVTKQATFTG